MTSACINNPHIRFSPDKFFNLPPTYACLTPRLPLLDEMHEQDDSGTNRIPSPDKLSDLPEESEPDLSDIVDFEFRLEEPVNMLPADQLFSDGKLFPLHFPVVHQEATSTSSEKAPKCSSKWKELLGLRKLYQNSNNAKQAKQIDLNPQTGIRHQTLTKS
ncbi:hypothetical protein L1987_79785 [Smallanthus sonchifolius]|uniref:Uncharacterized protein n=1 Tax=Smallanthus sonchifolius TaxID=185202 RepID=A0ACB8YL17_9ASTR|nr:hypothetical protein L1987_79785 [Smallanthus sonchifolius]